VDALSGDRAVAVLQVLATLGLTFVIGIEREERVARDPLLLGGVRTIPIIGLIGHGLALLSGGAPLPVALGLVGIAGILAVEYHRRTEHGPHGATSEMAILVAYLVGALVASGLLVVATTMTVATVLLLTSKDPLERLALRIHPREIAVFATFLIVAAVILPVLPDQDYTRFALNPHKTWLVVVVVSGLSYASYLAAELTHARESVLLTALFAPALALALLLRLFALAALGSLAGGILLMRRRGPAGAAPAATESALRHPLELGSATIFALLFLALSAATRWVASEFGGAGVRSLAAVVGLTDIDPFVLVVAHAASLELTPDMAASAVLIAAASNDVAKAGYALAFAERRAGLAALGGLLALAAATLALALAA